MYIQACLKQGPRGKGGANMGESSFTKKHIEKTFKNILLKNSQARKSNIGVEAFSSNVFSSMPKSGSPGKDGATIER